MSVLFGRYAHLVQREGHQFVRFLVTADKGRDLLTRPVGNLGGMPDIAGHLDGGHILVGKFVPEKLLLYLVKVDGEDKSKTRKKSDKNMDNYRKIVIADDSEQDEKYKSDYRGRVQDRNVSIKMEPMYALTYYEKLSEVKRIVHFHKYIEELNHSKLFPKPLRITNMEAPA